MAKRKNKIERPYYDRNKLRASVLVHQVIELEMENRPMSKRLGISKEQLVNIKKARPVSLEIVFKVARAMKKPVTDFLLK